jgi:putative membrane protein
LFTLIINTAMLGLTAWIAGWFDLAFDVDGFIAAFLGALVISIVSTVLSKWADTNMLRDRRASI